MKHTPAPWNLGTETLIVRSANRENHIADCGISYSLSDNEMKANAVLIAAAPELLEALEAMMKFAESRLSYLLRGRLYQAIKHCYKKGSAVHLLGCPINEFKKYLESKFTKGMTWENHGRGKDKWHIDHIKPLALFDLSDIDQLSQACHYSNLQPLWQRDNLKKGMKYEEFK